MLGHIMLAGAMKAPNIAIDDGEADKLASALDKVLSHYVNIDVDPKTRDWINLVVVMGGIYGPRAYAAFQNRNAKPATPKPAPVAATELKQPPAPLMHKVSIPGVGEIEVPVQQ